MKKFGSENNDRRWLRWQLKANNSNFELRVGALSPVACLMLLFAINAPTAVANQRASQAGKSSTGAASLTAANDTTAVISQNTGYEVKSSDYTPNFFIPASSRGESEGESDNSQKRVKMGDKKPVSGGLTRMDYITKLLQTKVSRESIQNKIQFSEEAEQGALDLNNLAFKISEVIQKIRESSTYQKEYIDFVLKHPNFYMTLSWDKTKYFASKNSINFNFKQLANISETELRKLINENFWRAYKVLCNTDYRNPAEFNLLELDEHAQPFYPHPDAYQRVLAKQNYVRAMEEDKNDNNFLEIIANCQSTNGSPPDYAMCLRKTLSEMPEDHTKQTMAIEQDDNPAPEKILQVMYKEIISHLNFYEEPVDLMDQDAAIERLLLDDKLLGAYFSNRQAFHLDQRQEAEKRWRAMPYVNEDVDYKSGLKMA